MAFHPLNGAFERVNRADEHLIELERLVQTFGQAYHHAKVTKFNAGVTDDPLGDLKVPTKATILIGEICYNLRAALDYLVFQLAHWDSGTRQEKTQFPLEMSPNDWRTREKRSLKGVNPSHIAEIKKLQPYNGCQWTKTLALISNPDKHMHLTPTCGSHVFSVMNLDDPSFSNVFHPNQISTICRTKAPDTGLEMEVKLVSSYNLSVPFERRLGHSVTDTLQEIKTEVLNLLEAFKPEFHIGDGHSTRQPEQVREA